MRPTPGSPLSRLLAVAALLLAIFLLWEGLAQPVIDLILGDGSLVTAPRSLDELGRVADRLPALAREKAALSKATAGGAGFLPGADPRLAAAALAGRLNGEIKTIGGDLVSSEALDLPDEDGIKRAGLRLRIGLPEADLPRLLHGLEYSDPTLFVQSLSITAGKDERLTIALDLYGYLGGGPDNDAGLADLPAGAYPDIVTRPIFNASRHGSAARAAALEASSLRLAGLVAEKGRTIALVSMDGGHEVRIGPGASLNGWRVDAIDGKGLDLAKDGRQMRVALKQAIPSAD